MSLEDRVRALRQNAIDQGLEPLPEQFQGVSKDRIRLVLTRLAFGTAEMVDAVFALLDDQHVSWFSQAAGKYFCDGASTAHIGCHVGILQRSSGKLDREGRDYWIKPLRAVGAVEPVYFHAKQADFILGHPIAKSSYSAYRLNEGFKKLLQASEDWEYKLEEWINEEAIRERLALQAAVAERSKLLVDTGHADLIQECQKVLIPRFLFGYKVIYIDDGDGDRITSVQEDLLQSAGVEIKLSDSMPDILLWNPIQNTLWVIEAVISDGEVDHHKQQALISLAQRSGKKSIGFTTAYRSWKDASARQGRFKNIAVETYLWIAEDPAKHWRAETYSHP